MNNQSNDTINIFFAGAAKIKTTPAPGTFINGDFVTHFAQHIHDDLYAKAVVLKSGNTTIAMVVVDICVMPKEFLDQVKTEIVKQTGISFQNILISSTHTHAAGSVASVYLAAVDSLYIQKLPGLIVESVINAAKNISPAKIAFGSVNIPEHVRCRRYYMQHGFEAINPVSGEADIVITNPFGNGHLIERPAAETDPQVSYLAIKDLKGNWISLLANYSMHYVGDWDNGTISADYFGEFAKALQQKLKAPNNFIGIMSNGTSGDANIWEFVPSGNYPTEQFKKGEFIGNDIAEKIFYSLEKIEWVEKPLLAVAYEELKIKVRKASEDEIEKAKIIISESDYENIIINEAGLKSIYAREQILLNELPDELSFPVQAIKIGNGIIGALGAEIFSETGLWLKENAPVKNYFTIGLANGSLGYVPPEHEFELGGYETWRSRTSKLEKDAENKIKNKLIQLTKNF